MSARIVLICLLTVIAFAFTSFVYSVTRRIRRARTELARRRYERAIVHAYELADDAEAVILGIG